jgi:hypothetical protein
MFNPILEDCIDDESEKKDEVEVKLSLSKSEHKRLATYIDLVINTMPTLINKPRDIQQRIKDLHGELFPLPAVEYVLGETFDVLRWEEEDRRLNYQTCLQ